MNRARFQTIWHRNLLVAAEDRSDCIFDSLLSAYQEDHRHYHNAEHIQHCLGLFDEVKDQLDNSDAVELAIWFHDVVYTPGKTNNEKLSTRFFLQQSDKQLSPKFRKQVVALIMSTTHKEAPGSLDESILVDIDLSSFGMPWKHFLEDGNNVRRELTQLSDEEYYRQQIKFQKKLLSRARFYFSEYFYARYEKNARNNLLKHLKNLKSLGYTAEAEV